MNLPSPITPVQYAKVYERICAEKSLTPDARSLILCLFLRFYAGLRPLPIPSLPLPHQITLKQAHLASNELHERKMGQKMKKVDGWYFLIDPDCELLRLPKVKQSVLENYKPRAATVTTHEVMQTWHQAYRDQFNCEHPRDQKDLVRFRYVLRKHGGPKTLQLVTEFIRTHAHKAAKATTLRFYNQHGRRQ